MNLVHRWWDWCSESLAHTFAGVTAPILAVAAFFVIVFYATHGGDSTPMPPRSDVAGVCATGTPGAAGNSGCSTAGSNGVSVSTATPVPPTPTPKPRTYTVQAGDTLSRICGNEAPDMALDDCVGRIVGLSGLAGPDEIFEGQTLTLPPGSSTTSSTSNRAPAATSTAVVVAVQPTTVPEPEPTRSASLVAIEPADVVPTEEPTPEPEPTEEPVEDPEPPETPTEEELNASGGSEYVVEAGDSLLGICVNEVPDMDEDECIEFVVLLNDLSGPDEIIEGQSIVLP